MSRLRTTFVLGYHGCEYTVAERLVAGELFEESTKDFDWLASGAYFWESDPERAWEWASQRPSARAFKQPAVVGAVIDLRNCLDLTTREAMAAVHASFVSFETGQRASGLPMPVNADLKTDLYGDRLLRRLDRAVIEHLHKNIEDANSTWDADGRRPEPFDTVRGMFPEGGEAFPGSGFKAKTHTQIAVRNPDCILGVFWPKGMTPVAAGGGGI